MTDPRSANDARSLQQGEAGLEENRRLNTPEQRFGARLGKRSSSEVLLGRLVEQEQRNLERAVRRFVDGSMERSAATIVAARRRFIFGSGKSYAYANLLATDLSAGLSQVWLIDGTVARGVDILSEVRDSDVLIAFSLRRYRRDSIDLAARFSEAGGTVVAITDAGDAPITKVANDVVLVSTDSASFADSPTAVAAAVHILATLTTASAKGARRRLARREELSGLLEFHVED